MQIVKSKDSFSVHDIYLLWDGFDDSRMFLLYQTGYSSMMLEQFTYTAQQFEPTYGKVKFNIVIED